MEIDSFLQIGYSHNICEDYIRHGDIDKDATKDRSFVVLSDGCSSAPDTDIGSRLLVLETIRQMNLGNCILEDKIFMNIVMEKGRMFDLKIDNFFATLLSIQYVHDSHFIVEMKGDGFIIARKRTGEIEIYQREFKSGAPYYPAYQYHISLDHGYFEKFNDVIMDKRRIIKDGKCIVNDVLPKSKASIDPVQMTFYETDYDMVAIASDGLNSFKRKTNPNEEIELDYIINQFMGFKHIKGEFVKRRLEKAISEMRKEGIDHYDDISFGAIYAD